MVDSSHLTVRLVLAVVIALMSASAMAQQRPAAFVDASTVVPNLIVEMRYLTANNFVGKPIDGYEKPVCYLTRQAAAALASAAKELEFQGLAVLAFDCYRPTRAVAHFVRWARDLGDTKMKAEYYPSVDKSTLFRDGYIASRSGHSRGSTIDMSLARKSDGRALDMGTPFDFFSTKSWPSDRRVSTEAQQNRKLLSDVMRRHGFDAYNKEWWHFTLKNEPFRDTYFDFPVR
jgi:D-alanyl-D-alanine dipeptidase